MVLPWVFKHPAGKSLRVFFLFLYAPQTESRPNLHRQLLYVTSIGIKQLSVPVRSHFLHLLQ